MHISQVVTGGVTFYTFAYDVCGSLCAVALLLLIARRRKGVVWYGLGVSGVALSPFFLSIVMGAIPAHRAQTVLPAATGILWLFGSLVISEEIEDRRKKMARGLLAAAGCWMIYLNIMPIMRLSYTRDMVGKADEAMAEAIISELNGISAAVRQEKGVIFIGHRSAQVNSACYTPDEYYNYVYASAFDMEYSIEPYYYYSSGRILSFFETLGVRQFRLLDVGKLLSAYEDSEGMPEWPLEGSVREFDDYVIVKLGEAEF